MKCTTPEISWHNREPVLSVDIHPIFTEFYRLASGGGDCHVLIWQMTIADNGAVKQELISDLTRHQKAVNCVRWSPSGQYLASADDDANIIIWQQKNDNIPSLENDNDKETWTHFKILRGHKEDIYDLCWSVNSLKLFSGSIDNTAILWDIQKGKLDHILTDHKGFVQGVTWDPKNQIIASISTDRICRIFDLTGKHVKARISKGALPVPSDHYLYEKEVKYFHDDTFKSFFRRLQFTPDGSLLIVPSGHMEADSCKKTINATLIFSLDNVSRPVAIMPLKRQNSTVVRCSPILFELKENGPDPLVKLPYRMVIAVGTDHDIILYDTQQKQPFARFQDMHYTRLTDLTWSDDGLVLVASSTDGFCTLITFDVNEIGVPYIREEISEEDNVLDTSGCEEVEKEKTMEKDENIDINNKETKEKEEVKKRPSFLEQWAKKPKLDKEVDQEKPEETSINKHSDAKPIAVRRKPKESNTESSEDKKPTESPGISTETEEKQDKPLDNTQKIRRRIAPIKIGEANPDKYKPKLIEVRRKPRNLEETKTVADECKKSDNSEEKAAKKHESVQIEENKGSCSQSEAKSIEEISEDKKIFTTSTESQKSNEEICENHKLVENQQTSSTPKINTEENKEQSLVTTEVINPDSSEKPTKSKKPVKRKLETENCTKIKVSSLVRKKPKKPETPSPKNTLLSFLKKSGEKKENKNTEKKNKKKLIMDPVDLTVEENALLEPIPLKETIQGCSSNKNELNAEEECTEDFTLQLEEDESKNEAIEEEKVNKTPPKNADNVEVGGKIKTENSEKKTPRKVPFITLASPKRLKLPKN